MKKTFLSLLFISIFFSISVLAEELEDLCKNGYGVILETSVTDDFEGCEYDKYYKLDNGLTFKCEEYSYSYSYHPDFYVLKNINYGDYKYMIDNELYDGKLYK